MHEHQLEGIWSYTTFEAGGVERPQDQVARMADIVLMGGEYLPGWNGLWAVVTYGYQGGTWSKAEVKASCRHIILGTIREGEAPASDFYLWAGGRFRNAPQRSPKEIDFEQFWGGTVLPGLQLGLYSIVGERLTLCLTEEGRPRPTTFSSREDPRQNLGQLVRASRTDRGAAPNRGGADSGSVL
jgi:hypothetical protein